MIALAIMLAMLVGLLVNGRWSEAPLTILTLLIGWGFASLYVAVLALPPAVLVVAFAEAVREQSAFFYGWAGVATAGVSATTLVLLASGTRHSCRSIGRSSQRCPLLWRWQGWLAALHSGAWRQRVKAARRARKHERPATNRNKTAGSYLSMAYRFWAYAGHPSIV